MRRFLRLRAVMGVTVLGGLLAAAPAVPAAASGQSSSYGSNSANSYLALGDSIPFGFSTVLADQGVTNPNRFVGYPEMAANLFWPPKQLSNASCPGETTTSLITGKADDDVGCRAWRAAAPLHVSYTGSQLSYAESFVATHPKTGLITMGIGANDLGRLVEAICGGDPTCIGNGLPVVLGTVANNLAMIYSDLRTAGFKGKFVVVNVYNFFNYPPADPLFQAINGVEASVTQAFGGSVVDSYGIFNAWAAHFGGDECKAGLLIRFPATPGTCDTHPTPLGAALIAFAVRTAA